jgi:hypothetical protein
MSTSLQMEVARRVRQVRRRLWLAELLQCLLASWAGALLIVAGYFMVHVSIWGRPTESQGWLALALGAAAGFVFGSIWAWKIAPGSIDSALAIDERFALKQRVTTYLSLTPEQAVTPAGQALLEDVHLKLAGLDVRDRFPVRVRWLQVVRPVLAGTLALLAFLFFPPLQFSFANDQKDTPAQANAAEAKKQIEELIKDRGKDKKDVPLSNEEKELDEKIKKMLDRDLSDEKQLRETIEEMRTLEEKMKERADDLEKQDLKNKVALGALEKLRNLPKFKDGPGKEFEDALARGDIKKAGEEIDKFARDMMQEGLRKEFEDALNAGDMQKAEEEIDRLAKKLKDLNNGPGKEFADALARQDMQKAGEELDRLQKKLKNNELNREEIAKLTERLEELQRELHRLHDHQDLRDLLADQLQKEQDAGNLTEEEKKQLQEALDRELDGLKENQADLKELADLLEEYKQGLLDKENGDDPGGEKLERKMARLKAQLDKLGLGDGNRRELVRLKGAMAQAEAIRRAMLRGMAGNGNGNGNGAGGDGRGAGARPPGLEPKDAKISDQRARTETDLKKLRITGYAKGGTFSKIPAQEVTGSFQQAVQEAAEASDGQRIPADVADISKGYFQRLGGQK